MMKSIRLLTAFALAVGIGFTLPGPAQAETHEVLMYTKNPDNPKEKNVFVPKVLKIQPGDTVKFVSAQKSHNTESIKGMIPDGAEKWKSKVSKDFEITFDKPGIYGYKCTPHSSLGMVGLVVVEGDGWDADLAAMKKVKQRGKAKKVFTAIWEELEAGS